MVSTGMPGAGGRFTPTGPTAVPTVTAPADPSPAISSPFLGELSYVEGYPTPETVQRLYDELDFQRGCQAALRNMLGLSMYSFREGLRRDLNVTSPRDFVIFRADANAILLTPNTETIYGTTFLDLAADGPTVVEAPAGVLGFVDDMWMRAVADLGPAGLDAGQGGAYLFVPPGYDGDLPKSGYFVVPSTTYGNWLLMRAFLGADGDPAPAIATLKQTRIYPYAQRDAPPAMRFLEPVGQPFDTDAPDDLRYFTSLATLVEQEPVDAIDPETAGVLLTIGIAKGTPFAPDERMQRILGEAARAGSLMAQALSYLPRQATRLSPDRQWLAALPGYPTFSDGHRTLLDGMIGIAWFGTGAAKAMAEPAPGTGSQYVWTYTDSAGDWLSGGASYRLRLPPHIPVKDFWSVVIYDVWTRATLANGQDYASKNSYDQALQASDDGSVDIFFGPEPPAGCQSNWIRTVPGKGWFTVFRLYGPLQPWFDREWLPDDVERL